MGLIKEDVQLWLKISRVNPFYKKKNIEEFISKQFGESLQLNNIFISKLFKQNFFHIGFEIENEMNFFLNQIKEGIIFDNKKLTFTKDKPNIKKYIQQEKTQENNAKHESILDKLSPYKGLTLQEQLLIKKEECLQNLKKIHNQILERKCCRIKIFQQWLNDTNYFESILKAQVFEHEEQNLYRNKVEYTIDSNNENWDIIIGFVLNSNGSSLDIQNDPNIPFINPIVYKISIQFQDFLNSLKSTNADFIAYNQLTKQGIFKNLLIRTSDYNKQMLIKLNCYFQSQEIQQQIKELLKDFIPQIKSDPYHVKQVFLQHSQDNTNIIDHDQQNQISLLNQPGFLIDQILDWKFQVPIGGFFQVHPLRASLMFLNIKNQIEINENTILLDICAGSGVVGISLGAKAHKIIFVESNEESCKTIRDNLTLNNLEQDDKKYIIFSQKAEKCFVEIKNIISGTDKEIVAVVDPPWAGLHPDVVKAIRTFIGLNKLIFISCDLWQAQQNLVHFCCEQSSQCKGPPFVPKSVHCHDLFPNTNHFETVFYLERDI